MQDDGCQPIAIHSGDLKTWNAKQLENTRSGKLGSSDDKKREYLNNFYYTWTGWHQQSNIQCNISMLMSTDVVLMK